ncbi:MAG: thermonuclease family protein [Burkholderiaceae bacterium]
MGRRAQTALVRIGLALCGLLAACACAAMSGVVTRVTDGDTLWVRPLEGGKPRKLRVQGIDAPERCQSGGREATARMKALVLGQTVRAQEGPIDNHGRRLVRLMRGDTDIGAQLVREGHAWSYRWRYDLGPYAAEEREARAARRGVFADPAAITPREFRRLHGPCR